MNKLITIKQVCDITGFQKSSIYKRIAEGTFVAPIKIGRSSRWDSEAVSTWVENAITTGKVNREI